MRTLYMVAALAAAAPWLRAAPAAASVFTVETVAGGGRPDSPTFVPLGDLNGIAVDRWGNVYFSDTDHHRVCRIAVDGSASTVAGIGSAGFSGDGGPATAAQLNIPYGLAVDAAGNLYVADLGNQRVRRVALDGSIATVAAGLISPRNIAFDAAGNLYISEFEGHSIRRVKPDGHMETLAGNGVPGYGGDGGPAVLAALAFPAGLGLDAAGNLYIADSQNRAIRRIAPDGIITTVLGAPQNPLVPTPVGLAVDAAGSVYFSDQTATVRRLLPGGILMRVAGTGTAGYSGDGGPALTSQLAAPRDLALDATGNLYLADGQRPRKVLSSGITLRLISDLPVLIAPEPARAPAARLERPSGVALDAAGNLYVSESGAHRVRKITPQGLILTVAGTGTAGGNGDGGPARFAHLRSPGGLVIDSGGNLVISDTENQRLRLVRAPGIIQTFTGAPLLFPRGLAADTRGNLYVADTGNHRVLQITPAGMLAVAAGTGTPGDSGDGGPAGLARLRDPAAVAVDSEGSLYIADTGNHRVRRVDPEGRIRSLAGGGTRGFGGDEGIAVTALLDGPAGVAAGPGGVIYVADTGNHRIRAVLPDGTIRTVAGGGGAGFGGDGGPGLAAQFSSPAALAAAADGNLYVADTGNQRVRKLVAQAAPPEPTVDIPEAKVVSAANLSGGPLAPGEVVSIFAAGIGPEPGVRGGWNERGLLETAVADTQALFEGEAAPLFYVSSGQITAQAPYTLAGRQSAEIEVRYQGKPRARVTVAVAEAAPALFAMVLNQDGGINSPENPAPRGSVVTLFATGEGQTVPPSVSGRPAAVPAPAPALPVAVRIADIPAEVQFAGSAPGLIGVLQVNVRVPDGFAPSGVLPVSLRVGETTSPPGVILAVK